MTNNVKFTTENQDLRNTALRDIFLYRPHLIIPITRFLTKKSDFTLEHLTEIFRGENITDLFRDTNLLPSAIDILNNIYTPALEQGLLDSKNIKDNLTLTHQSRNNNQTLNAADLTCLLLIRKIDTAKKLTATEKQDQPEQNALQILDTLERLGIQPSNLIQQKLRTSSGYHSSNGIGA